MYTSWSPAVELEHGERRSVLRSARAGGEYTISDPVIPGWMTRRNDSSSSTACLARRCTSRMTLPGKPAQQPAAGHAAQHVIVAEVGLADASPDEAGADIANNGFDFGKLWHGTDVRP